MSPSLLDIPAVRSYLKRKILIDVPTQEKRIALTFDDGPNPRHTPRILDMLASKNVRATFFVVGRYVRRFRDVLRTAAQEGHEIGNHSDHHVPMSVMPGFLVRREISVAGRLITDACGRRPRFFRPPMGWFNDRLLAIVRHMGYDPVIGSIHPRDSRRPGTRAILERMRNRIEPGAIIILHDGGWRVGSDRSQTIEAADRITDELLANGYRFETLSQLVDGGRESG